MLVRGITSGPDYHFPERLLAVVYGSLTEGFCDDRERIQWCSLWSVIRGLLASFTALPTFSHTVSTVLANRASGVSSWLSSPFPGDLEEEYNEPPLI